MTDQFKSVEEFLRVCRERGFEVRQNPRKKRMSLEELLESGAIDETAKHEGEGTIIVGTGKRKPGK